MFSVFKQLYSTYIVDEMYSKLLIVILDIITFMVNETQTRYLCNTFAVLI